MDGTTRVSWTRCADYDEERVAQALKTCLEPLGGMDSFIQPGNRVLCKCNLLMPARPDQAVTTHPAILRAVIREVKRCGGIPLVGDNSASTPLRLTMQRAGLVEVCEAEGAELVDLAESVEIRSSRTDSPRPFTVSRAMIEADVYIGLPKLKSHSLCTMTLATKNLFGLVPGLAKARWHLAARTSRSFSSLVVDLYAAILENARFKGRMLHILDGILAMEGEGPGPGGTPRNLGILLASTDAVALDRVACHAVGVDIARVHTCRIAGERLLGEADLGRIDIQGGDLLQPLVTDWKLPTSTSTVEERLEMMGPLQRVARSFLLDRPIVNRDLCTGCGQCARICASEAIRVDKELKKARVEETRCIRCYCCAEVCPEKAVRKGPTPFLGRVAGAHNLPLFLAGAIVGFLAVGAGVIAWLVW